MINKLDIEPVICDASKLRMQSSMHIGFVNTTGKTVTVVWRDGRVDTIPSTFTATTYTGTFEVIYSITAKREVLIRMVNDDTVLSRSKEAYRALLGQPSTRDGTHSLRFTVSYNELEGCRGSFIDTLDLLITMKQGNEIPKHPYANTVAGDALTTLINTKALTYRIIMVDLYALCGNRYVNINGSPYKIPTINNVTLPDGIYIALGTADDFKITRYIIDDPTSEIRTYKSMGEAETSGGELTAAMAKLSKKEVELEKIIDANRRMEITATAEADSKIAKLELDKQYLNYTLAEQERTVDNLKKNIEAASKIAEVEVKSEYDKQSTARKNGVEWMKVATHILGVIGLAAGLYKGA